MPRPTGRVLVLLELLQSGGTRTAAELADRLGVDERTVRRYVDHLVDLDVPVESVRGRYGGYRLGPGYRLPPLMLSDDEAVAVLLGLLAGRRAGLPPTERTAAETASAKVRRVLPRHLAARLDALLAALDVTDPAGVDVPDTGVLLAVADAVRHRRPLAVRYTDRDGRRSDRTLRPHGIVAHSGRWYVTGEDVGVGAQRTLRLDRVAEARALPGTFPPPAGPSPGERVVAGFATADYRHQVTLRIQATTAQVRAHLPASVAVLAEDDPADSAGDDPAGDDPATERWRRVELRVERLDWLPAVLAALDRPFVIERPAELRDHVLALAHRLAASARRTDTG
jgi:predicted DNA-binding transcriptional regulator YafY